MQRCVFQAFGQITRATTTRPRLEASKEFDRLGISLLHVRTLSQADVWVQAYGGVVCEVGGVPG